MSRDNDEDLDALIASLNPVTRPSSLTPAPAAVLGGVLERAERRRRRRRLKLLLPAVPVSACLITAGSLLLRPSPAADPFVQNVECSVDLSSDQTVVTPVMSTDPTVDCRRLWASGGIRPGEDDVPPLTACVLNGQTRVYPAVDACRLLSIPPFAGYSAAQIKVIGLAADLNGFFVAGPPCRPAEEVAAYAREQLSRRGLVEWRVVLRSDRACDGIVTDGTEKTVLID